MHVSESTHRYTETTVDVTVGLQMNRHRSAVAACRVRFTASVNARVAFV